MTMGQRAKPIRVSNRQAGGSPARTTRINDAVWDKAKVRAARDGVSMSQMMYTLVEGYSEGKIDLPRMVMVYPDNTN